MFIKNIVTGVVEMNLLGLKILKKLKNIKG
jgi:hypothetical protein